MEEQEPEQLELEQLEWNNWNGTIETGKTGTVIIPQLHWNIVNCDVKIGNV